MNSKILSKHKICKKDSNTYIPPSSTKYVTYTAAVTSNSNRHLYNITSQLNKIPCNNLPQGHPNTAAMGMFIAKRPKQNSINICKQNYPMKEWVYWHVC